MLFLRMGSCIKILFVLLYISRTDEIVRRCAFIFLSQLFDRGAFPMGISVTTLALASVRQLKIWDNTTNQLVGVEISHRDENGHPVYVLVGCDNVRRVVLWQRGQGIPCNSVQDEMTA
jgi:hypothetical protein